MSSSFHKRALVAQLLVLGSAGASCAFAQQTVITPAVDVAAEWDSNREMVPEIGNPDASTNYKATLETTFARRTPRSQTTFRPRIVAQEFPDRQGVDPIEAFADLRTTYRTLKGSFGLLGRYARQDAIHAEFSEAAFDEFDPQNPQAAQTDIVLVGQTRTTVEVAPSFGYELTEKTALDASLEYQSVDYSQDISGTSQSYSSPYAELTVTHQLTQRAGFAVGPYYTHFETDDNVNTTDTTGGLASFNYKWSEITFTTLALRVEHNEVEDTRLVQSKEKSTDWGLELTGARKLRLGQFRYSVGRFLSPSTLGSRRRSDQIRLQYARPLSPKLDFGSAVRLVRDTRVGSDPFATTNTNGRRERARGELNLRWMLTRTMYVSGGYQFWWQDFGGTNDTARNHAVILSFGYRAYTP